MVAPCWGFCLPEPIGPWTPGATTFLSPLSGTFNYELGQLLGSDGRGSSLPVRRPFSLSASSEDTWDFTINNRIQVGEAGEVEFLRWRVSSLADEQRYVDLADAQVTIALDGAEFGPFALRQSRRDPGLYETRHVSLHWSHRDTVMISPSYGRRGSPSMLRAPRFPPGSSGGKLAATASSISTPRPGSSLAG